MAFVALVVQALALPPWLAAQTRGQDSVRVQLDSLARQLARTDSALRLLQQQLAVESASQVRLRSRIQLELSARLVLNGSLTRGSASNAEVPLFAAMPRTPAAEGGASTSVPSVVGMSFRQSAITASASVDSVAGATLLADFELDLFARALDANPPLFPEPRLRTARVFLLWPRTEVMVGQDTPLMSDLNPISVAGVSIPVFSGAGNLWNWMPQVRLTRSVWAPSGRAWQLALQGAVQTPYVAERWPDDPQGADVGQASGRPAFEGRLRVRHGEELDERAQQSVWRDGLELGLSTHQAWVKAPNGTMLRSWAAGADVRVALGLGFELRGEAYSGQLLRGLGGGAIGQNVLPLEAGVSLTPIPLRNTAGWLQLNQQWHPAWIAGAGCGVDRVHDARAARRRNGVCAVHTQWRPVQPLFVALEWRTFRTHHLDGLRRASHFNLGIGVDL